MMESQLRQDTKRRVRGRNGNILIYKCVSCVKSSQRSTLFHINSESITLIWPFFTETVYTGGVSCKQTLMKHDNLCLVIVIISVVMFITRIKTYLPIPTFSESSKVINAAGDATVKSVLLYWEAFMVPSFMKNAVDASFIYILGLSYKHVHKLL